jgi:hypothetical protein
LHSRRTLAINEERKYHQSDTERKYRDPTAPSSCFSRANPHDTAATVGKKCTDRSTLHWAGPDCGDGRFGHPSRHDRRSRCGSGTSEWGPSYTATDKRVRLIAVVLNALILIIDTGELLAVVVPHDAPLSSSADQGGGKRRLGIAWSFDAAANYFNSCSRVNLAYGDDTMRVTHTFDYVALGVLTARPIIIALFSL